MQELLVQNSSSFSFCIISPDQSSVMHWLPLIQSRSVPQNLGPEDWCWWNGGCRKTETVTFTGRVKESTMSWCHEVSGVSQKAQERRSTPGSLPLIPKRICKCAHLAENAYSINTNISKLTGHCYSCVWILDHNKIWIIIAVVCGYGAVWVSTSAKG